MVLPPPTRRKVQALTGLPIAYFLVLHLATHASMHAGADAHRRVFLALRRMYNGHPLLEAALLGSIAVHCACAVDAYAELTHEQRVAMFFSGDWGSLAHRVSGWTLLSLVGGHVLATRAMPSLSNLVEAAYGWLPLKLLPEVFVPYYTVFLTAGAVHLVSGTARASKTLRGPGLDARSTRFWAATGALTALALSSVAALSGVYFPLEADPDVTRRVLASFATYWPKQLLDVVVRRAGE